MRIKLHTKSGERISPLWGAIILLIAIGIFFIGLFIYTRLKLVVNAPREDNGGVPASYAVRDESMIVTIRNMKFDPPIIIIKKGEKVIFMNKDTVNHKIKSDSKDLNFFSKELLPEEQSEFVINQSGVFDYSCEIHPQMKGQIVVRE